MKKLLLLACVAAISVITGCGKKAVTPDPVIPPLIVNNWTIDAASYNVKQWLLTTSDNGDVLVFWDDTPSSTLTPNAVTVTFGERTLVSGSYQLVGSGTALGPKQIHLQVSKKEGKSWLYSASTPVDVAVTATDASIKLVIPEVTLKSTGTLADVKFTATVAAY